MGPWVHGLRTGSSLTRYQNMTSGVGFHQICCQVNNKQLIFVGLSGRDSGLKSDSHQIELIALRFAMSILTILKTQYVQIQFLFTEKCN